MNFLEIYKNAYYLINDFNYYLKLDQKNHLIDNILSENNANYWAFITAFNPNSIPFSEIENQYFNQNLLSDLTNYKIFKGEGGDKNNLWTHEISYFIIDITEKSAFELAKKYNQKAFIYVEIYSIPKIIFV